MVMAVRVRVQAVELEARLASERAEADGSGDDGDAENANLLEQLSRALEALEDVKSRCMDLEAATLEIQNEREFVVDRLAALSEAGPSDDEKTATRLREELAEGAAQLSKHRTESIELREQVAVLSDALRDASQACEEARVEHGKKVSELTMEAAQPARIAKQIEHQVQPAVVALQQQLRDAHDRIARLDNDVIITREALETAERDLIAIDKKVDRSTHTLSIQQTQESQMKNDLLRLKEVEIGHQAERVELASRIKLAKGEAKSLVAAMTSAAHERERGLMRLKQVQIHAAQAQQKLDSDTVRIAEFETEIKLKNREIKELAAKTEQTKREKANIETQLLTGTAMKETEYAEVKAAKQRADRAEKLLNAARKECNDLERDRKAAERLMDKALAESSKTANALVVAEQEVLDSRTAMNDAKDRLARLDMSVTECKELYVALRSPTPCLLASQ
jgi:chromosome segregation ATPase